MRFKNLEGKPERESPKRTISASDWFGPSQMVSELDIGRCVSGRLSPEGGWTRDGVPMRMLGPEGSGL